jgi:hypothetical protein
MSRSEPSAGLEESEVRALAAHGDPDAGGYVEVKDRPISICMDPPPCW